MSIVIFLLLQAVLFVPFILYLFLQLRRLPNLRWIPLAASQKFTKKRLGYLGVTLLVENKDVLVLITNSLKRHV